MKKIAILLMMLAMMLSVAACGDKTEASGENPDDKAWPVAVVPETDPAEDEEFVKMYGLTNIEYVMADGETVQGEFIPGSEVYIFTEGKDYRDFEYKYRKYPTEEDRANDSNYSIESVYGTYTLNGDKTQLALMGQNGVVNLAEVIGDKIIFEFDPEGYDVKIVMTYTETDEADI